jgi:hypothetical protein
MYFHFEISQLYLIYMTLEKVQSLEFLDLVTQDFLALALLISWAR